jgi:hypothetical protein
LFNFTIAYNLHKIEEAKSQRHLKTPKSEVKTVKIGRYLKRKYRASLSVYSTKRTLNFLTSSKYHSTWNHSIKINYENPPPIADHKLPSDIVKPVMRKYASLPDIQQPRYKTQSNQEYREKYLLGGKEEQDNYNAKINLTNRASLLPKKTKPQYNNIYSEDQLQDKMLKKLINEIRLKSRYVKHHIFKFC